MTVLPLALPPAPALNRLPESRAWAIDYARPLTPDRLAGEIDLASRAGFNLIVVPVYINGYTLFPSRAARAIGFDAIDPQCRRWNPVAEAIERARARGMTLWGLVRPHNFNPHFVAGRHRLLRKFPRWRIKCHPDCPRSELRRREKYIACPVNPEYRRYLGDMLAELTQTYPLDGVVLHYRGYGLRTGSIEEHPFCFCAACRARFREKRDADLIERSREEGGPAEIRGWQTRASSANLRYLRHRMTRTRRDLRFFAWAQPQWRWALDATGPLLRPHYCLDWNGLLKEGTLEGLIVDPDEELAGDQFRSRLVSDLAELHGEALLLPAVRLGEVEGLGAPLEAIRRYAVSGLLVESAEPLTPESADAIRDRFFGDPARPPESASLQSVAYLLRRVRAAHDDSPLISDFMRDLLRLIEKALTEETSFESLEVIYENLAGLQAGIRRGRLGDYAIPESTLRDLGLARRLVRLGCMEVRA